MAARRHRSGSRGSRRGRRTKNGFIIFFLLLLKQTKSRDVVKTAIQAGKCWNKMTTEQKCRFIRMARRLQKRRRSRKCR